MQVRVAGQHVIIVSLYYVIMSGVLCRPRCHVKITNVTCLNTREGRDWDLALRMVERNSYLGKVLGLGMIIM